MSRFFIERPVFAWVIAIVIMLAGALVDHHLADRAISRHRAALDQHQCDLSGRLGGDVGELGHPGDRAAADRPRQSSLFLLVEHSSGEVDDHRHLRGRHQCRHRPGPGAEQAAAGDSAPAAGGEAARRDRDQGAHQLPDGRRRSTTRPGKYTNIDISDFMASTLQDPLARVKASAMSTSSAPNMRCGSGSIPSSCADLQADARRRARRRPGAEHPGRRRLDRRAAGRPGPGAQRDGDRPVAASHRRAVPQHHPAHGDGRRDRASLRRRPRRAGRGKLRHLRTASTAIRRPASPSSLRPAPMR